jgi:hypothetical protein
MPYALVLLLIVNRPCWLWLWRLCARARLRTPRLWPCQCKAASRCAVWPFQFPDANADSDVGSADKKLPPGRWSSSKKQMAQLAFFAGKLF